MYYQEKFSQEDIKKASRKINKPKKIRFALNLFCIMSI